MKVTVISCGIHGEMLVFVLSLVVSICNLV